MNPESTQSANGTPFAGTPGSAIQERLLRRLAKEQTQSQIAGYGMAQWLSAARALERRGLASSYRTGWYYATESGEEWVRAHSPNKETRS